MLTPFADCVKVVVNVTVTGWPSTTVAVDGVALFDTRQDTEGPTGSSVCPNTLTNVGARAAACCAANSPAWRRRGEPDWARPDCDRRRGPAGGVTGRAGSQRQ